MLFWLNPQRIISMIADGISLHNTDLFLLDRDGNSVSVMCRWKPLWVLAR